MNELEQQLQQAQFRSSEKESSIDNLMEDKSTAELQHIIENFTSEMQRKIIEAEDVEQQVHCLEVEISELREEEHQLQQQKGKAELLRSKVQQLKEKQLQLGVELQGRYNLSAQLDGVSGDYSDAAVRAFAACLEREVT